MDSDTLLYCSRCFALNGIKVPLKLKIIETTEWDAEFKRAKADKIDYETSIPTFEIETGEGTVDYEPKFVCPVCKTLAYSLNNKTSYDEESDLLYIDGLDDNSLLGYRESFTRKEPELPKIQRVSQVCHSD